MSAPPAKERPMKASVIALAVLWTGALFAQAPPSPVPAAHIDRLATLLDLSDAQKTQVQAILQDEHARMHASFDQAKASGTKPDWAQMQALHAQIQQETLQKLAPVLSGAQLVATPLAAQVAALLVPGAEHDALRRAAIGLEIMYARAVGVPVDHAPPPGGPKRRGHRVGIHVHDVGYRARGVPAAAGARLIGEQLPVRARQGEEALLPIPAAHHAAQLLVGMIVGAQRIAVREQHPLAVELRHHRIGEQAAAAALAETLTEQEVAIAVQREAGDTARAECAQSPAHPLLGGIAVVISHPGLEQVAEDVERLGGRGLGGEKPEELLRGLGRAGIQMHVRDEQARHAVTSARGSCPAAAAAPGLPPARCWAHRPRQSPSSRS